MKSILTPILLTTLLSSNLVSTRVEEVYYINENNVEMTEENYNKLMQLGYSERELRFLSQKEYDDRSSLMIYNVMSNSCVMKYTYFFENNNYVLTQSSKISKDIAIQEINNSNNILTRGLGSEESNYTNEYIELSLTGVVTSGGASIRKFFVKIDAQWLSTPAYCDKDYISINIDDDIQIFNEYINGSQRPKFYSSFTYTTITRNYYNNIISGPVDNTSVTESSIEVNGDDVDQYKYNIDQGLVVQYELPSGFTTREEGIGYYSEYSITYHNFHMSINAEFTSQIEDLCAVTFGGAYSHNDISIINNLNNVSLSLSYPFIHFDGGINIGNAYQGFGCLIFFDEDDFFWPTC